MNYSFPAGHNPIQILKNEFKLPFDIPTEHGHQTSYIMVMQEFSSWELSDMDYLSKTGKLLDQPGMPLWNKKHMAKYVLGYLIQNLTRNYIGGVVEDLNDVYRRSCKQADVYIDNNQWVFATGEDENAPPKLDAAGNVKQAKGDKKVKAKELWTANQGKITTRKGWIDLLVAECGMTTAGASTYYHNLKTGVY